MGVQLPLPAPLIKPISRLFVFTYVSWSLIREARVPDVRYKNGYSAHPINFEQFRRLIAFRGIADVRSVSPIYARLWNV